MSYSKVQDMLDWVAIDGMKPGELVESVDPYERIESFYDSYGRLRFATPHGVLIKTDHHPVLRAVAEFVDNLDEDDTLAERFSEFYGTVTDVWQLTMASGFPIGIQEMSPGQYGDPVTVALMVAFELPRKYNKVWTVSVSDFVIAYGYDDHLGVFIKVMTKSGESVYYSSSSDGMDPPSFSRVMRQYGLRFTQISDFLEFARKRSGRGLKGSVPSQMKNRYPGDKRRTVAVTPPIVRKK